MIDKEVSDALHMLLNCSLKNTEYETQKENFKTGKEKIENEMKKRAPQSDADYVPVKVTMCYREPTMWEKLRRNSIVIILC